MNTLHQHLTDYLELRRGLGFDLDRVESRLRAFLAWLQAKRTSQITTALAIEFALRPTDRSASTQSGYLSAIRGFARYMSGIDPRTEIAPVGLVRKDHRPRPHIYSEEEIAQILQAAREHPSSRRYALKPSTLYCVLGLLATTGMRLTEALSIKAGDIDWNRGVLTVGRAKFQKSRLIPLHRSTLRQLHAYAERRDCFFTERPWRRPADRFFLSTHGGALSNTSVGGDFRRLTVRVGLREPGAHHGPRIHDLRHSFAVSTLLRWYRSGKGVDPLLPALSTYLEPVPNFQVLKSGTVADTDGMQ